MAGPLRQLPRAQGECLTIQNYAAEVKLRAERRAGELLAEMPKDEGGRPAKRTGSIVEPVSKLNDLGISKKQSHRWQAVATVPERQFEQHIADTKAAQEEKSLRLCALRFGVFMLKLAIPCDTLQMQKKVIKCQKHAGISVFCCFR